MVLQRRVSRPYLKLVNDSIYYVPFLKSLDRLLSDPLVFEEVSWVLTSREFILDGDLTEHVSDQITLNKLACPG